MIVVFSPVGQIVTESSDMTYSFAGPRPEIACVAVAALLLGLPWALVVGVAQGLALILHALTPYADFAEKFYLNPLTLCASALAALVAVVLCAALRRHTTARGTGARTGAFALVSLAAAATWAVARRVLFAAYASVTEGSAFIDQFSLISDPEDIAIGTVVTALCCVVVLAVVGTMLRRYVDGKTPTNMHAVFRRWIAGCVALGFALSCTVVYTIESVEDHAQCQLELGNQVSYFLQRVGTANDGGLQKLVDGYILGEDDGVAILHDSVIVASSFQDEVGQRVDAELYTTPTSDDDQVGPMHRYPVAGKSATQIMYLRAAEKDGYVVYATQSVAECYASRTRVTAVITVVFVALFLMVYAAMARLVDGEAVTGLRRINATLERITSGDLSQRADVRTNDELAELTDGINTTVDALEGWIAEANARIDSELSAARAIQSAALPQTFPPFPDIDAFDIYASMNTAREVGGDFYDFFLVEDPQTGKSRLCFLIADVSGKGIPASLFMMRAKDQIKDSVLAGGSFADAVAKANDNLCESNETQMFVTAFLCLLDYETGTLACVNAGHNPPMLLHAASGEWEWLREKGGLFLGAFAGMPYTSYDLTLERGDEILLYTDGVTEAMDVNEELYGEDRLEEFLKTRTDLKPRALIADVAEDLARYAEGAEQSDDITMVSLIYGVAPSEDAAAE